MLLRNVLRLPRRRRAMRDRGATQRLRFEHLEPRQLLAVAAAGAELRVNDLIIREQTTAGASTAVAASNANTVVAFAGKGPQDGEGVFAEVLSPDGGTVKASFRVNATIRGAQYTPAVASDANGNFVVAWAGRGVGDKHGVFFQRYNAAGVAQGGETLVNVTTGGAQREPAVVMADDGSFIVAWSGVGAGDLDGVFLRRFSATGGVLSGEVLVNTTTDEEQTEPAVALDAAGNLVVAWTSRHQTGDDDRGVFARQFDAVTNTPGAEFALATTTAGSQWEPAVATNPTGGFVAAWTSENQGGGDEGVVSRAFDNAAAATSGELVVSDQSTGRQREPSVAVDATGNVLVAFSTGVADGSGWDVAARSLSPSFVPDGASFAVNQETAGFGSEHQFAPTAVAVGATAAIAWSGRGASDWHGTFVQRYTTDDDGPQVAPVLINPGPQTGVVGQPFTVTVTATDDNFNDVLGIQLDEDDSPAGATRVQAIGARTAVISYTPVRSDAGQTLLFRVNVSDNGVPPLGDTIDFLLTVAAASAPLSAPGAAADAAGDAAAIDAALGDLL